MMAPFADAKTAHGVAKADVCLCDPKADASAFDAQGAASAISNSEISTIAIKFQFVHQQQRDMHHCNQIPVRVRPIYHTIGKLNPFEKFCAYEKQEVRTEGHGIGREPQDLLANNRMVQSC